MFGVKKLKLILLFCAVTACWAEADEDQPNVTSQPVTEELYYEVHRNYDGYLERLQPNLVGLRNLAIKFLPPNLALLDVVEASREIVNGVRYYIIVNTVDAERIERICELIILEQPWLVTIWGDKLRYLQYTNCSSNFIETSTNPPSTEINSIFTVRTTELTDKDITDLESQIIPLKPTTQKPLVTTTEVLEPETTQAQSEDSSNKESELSSDVKDILDQLFLFDHPITETTLTRDNVERVEAEPVREVVFAERLVSTQNQQPRTNTAETGQGTNQDCHSEDAYISRLTPSEMQTTTENIKDQVTRFIYNERQSNSNFGMPIHVTNDPNSRNDYVTRREHSNSELASNNLL